MLWKICICAKNFVLIHAWVQPTVIPMIFMKSIFQNVNVGFKHSPLFFKICSIFRVAIENYLTFKIVFIFYFTFLLSPLDESLILATLKKLQRKHWVAEVLKNNSDNKIFSLPSSYLCNISFFLILLFYHSYKVGENIHNEVHQMPTPTETFSWEHLAMDFIVLWFENIN